MADSKYTLEVGMILDGKWVILEFIGKGGMGEVYRAHQLNLNRDVAIKIISQEWLKSFDCEPEEVESSVDRFRREVQVMAQILHPNVLQIFDEGTTAIQKGDEQLEITYIVMEYVPGSSLRTTMSEEGFYPEEDRTREWLTAYFLPLLGGVQALHDRGIVHRDLKPENVLLTGNTPKIADFGLASSCSLKPITRSAHVMGTPPYMAQEQFMDLRRTDHRADIYSLGKILYEAIVGKLGPDQIPFKQARLKDPQDRLFVELDRIIQHATAEDKNARFASAEELAGSVREALDGLDKVVATDRKDVLEKTTTQKTSTQMLKWLAALLVILIIGVMGYLALLREKGGKRGMVGTGPTIPQIEAPIGKIAETPTRSGELSKASKAALPAAIKGKDDTTLYLVPGGEIVLPKNFSPVGAEKVKIDSFYMDMAPVTIHQYVEFLNQTLDRIKVESGVVKGDDQIWLLLGEVKPGYEPIEYRGGRFHIKASQHAACPVLRVTGYGAAAYADFFGKRLSTDVEWLFALEAGKSPSGEGDAAAESQKNLPIPSPVMLYKPNSLGIRGLDANIGEWGIESLPDQSHKDMANAEYVVLGEMFKGGAGKSEVSAPLQRYPWEAFENVGFRCVQDAR